MKILIALILLLSVGCTASTVSSGTNNTGMISSSVSNSQQITSSSVATELIELTLEELKQFDGKNGRKAYIAVDGFVYDVSRSFRWFGGNHNGYTAGRDLTLEIDTVSPHGRSTLSEVPLIGKIVP
jgi:predicted heme/steroid binding protein